MTINIDQAFNVRRRQLGRLKKQRNDCFSVTNHSVPTWKQITSNQVENCGIYYEHDALNLLGSRSSTQGQVEAIETKRLHHWIHDASHYGSSKDYMARKCFDVLVMPWICHKRCHLPWWSRLLVNSGMTVNVNLLKRRKGRGVIIGIQYSFTASLITAGIVLYVP